MNFYDILFARKLAGGGGDIPPHSYQLKSIANTPTPIATFNASALPMPSLSVGIEAVQSGSGDPSPTNVRPISGWSAVNVTRCGKNLIPYVEFGVLNQTDGSEEDNTSNKRTGFIRTLPNTQYTISGLEGSGISIRIFEYKKDKTYIGNYVAPNITNSVTIQTGAEVGYIRFQGNETLFASSMAQCEKGNRVTDFEAYNEHTYTTTLKDGQGNAMTCYGGQLSNVNGVQSLTDARGHVVYDGSNDEAWGNYSSNYNGFPIIITGSNIDATNPSTQLMCDKLAVSTVRGPSGEKPIKTYTSTSDNNAIFVSIEGITEKADFLTYLSNNNIEIVYPLATPQQISQDNLAISTQDGTNNLWADSGDVLSGEYLEAL